VRISGVKATGWRDYSGRVTPEPSNSLGKSLNGGARAIAIVAFPRNWEKLATEIEAEVRRAAAE